MNLKYCPSCAVPRPVYAEDGKHCCTCCQRILWHDEPPPRVYVDLEPDQAPHGLTVGELRERLAQFPDEMLVKHVDDDVREVYSVVDVAYVAEPERLCSSSYYTTCGDLPAIVGVGLVDERDQILGPEDEDTE